VSTTAYLGRLLSRFAAELQHLPAALRLVWKAAPTWTLAWLLLLVIQGLLPVATVYLTRDAVDALASGLGAGAAPASWHSVLVACLGLGLVLLLAEVLPSLAAWISLGQSELLHDNIRAAIHRKSVDVDLAFYDTPTFYDHLHRARDEGGFRPVAILASLGSLLQSALTLVAMAGIVLPFGFWLPLALLVATLPALWVVLRHTVRLHEWRRHGTPRERRARYYDWLLTSGGAAAEVRLFDLGSRFRGAFADLRGQLRRERLDLARSQSVAQAFAAAVAMAVAGGALLWMARWTALGRLSLGELAMLYQAFFQGLKLMRSLLESAGQLYANIMFLGNLFEFFELRPGLTDPDNPLPVPLTLARGIRFRGVVFQYPGGREPALRGLDLEIAAGRFVAIVGSNGAGKSTLVRLLCRLYDPAAGAIELDGIDLRRFRAADVRRRTTALFQEPVHYNASVGENIDAGRSEAGVDQDRVRRAAGLAGVDRIVSRLPSGYDTLLGTWFESGTELSVGEWQRVALARAYARETPIVVLDEPTSAMDPWAEREWADRFREAMRGRTAIVITHRLTTAMHADTIHVMSEGRIVESGAHQQLLDAAGLYAQAWELQREGRGAG
jgi:ATP-binding cassette subfamily B protein